MVENNIWTFQLRTLSVMCCCLLVIPSKSGQFNSIVDIVIIGKRAFFLIWGWCIFKWQLFLHVCEMHTHGQVCMYGVGKGLSQWIHELRCNIFVLLFLCFWVLLNMNNHLGFHFIYISSSCKFGSQFHNLAGMCCLHTTEFQKVTFLYRSSFFEDTIMYFSYCFSITLSKTLRFYYHKKATLQEHLTFR